jgi:phosphoribosyl-AMP cyclohydrolase
MSAGAVFEEPGPPGELERGSAFTPRFGDDGLLPAIVSDARTNAVLMFAWMNRDALRLTLDTGKAHFWSRSRGKLWLKGEESGNVLLVSEVRVDCDQDVILVVAELTGAGVACHTGAKSCFYRAVGRAAGSDGPYLLRPTS